MTWEQREWTKMVKLWTRHLNSELKLTIKPCNTKRFCLLEAGHTACSGGSLKRKYKYTTIAIYSLYSTVHSNTKICRAGVLWAAYTCSTTSQDKSYTEYILLYCREHKKSGDGGNCCMAKTEEENTVYVESRIRIINCEECILISHSIETTGRWSW